MYVFLHACMHVCMCVYVCMYACVYVCMCVCMCVYMWACVYVRVCVHDNVEREILTAAVCERTQNGSLSYNQHDPFLPQPRSLQTRHVPSTMAPNRMGAGMPPGERGTDYVTGSTYNCE